MLTDDDILHRVTLGNSDRKYLGITPFSPESVNTAEGRPIVSRGLSSCGYDFAVDPEWWVANERSDVVVDPLTIYDEQFGGDREFGRPFLHLRQGSVVLPPGGFALAFTTETFRIPEDCHAVVFCKSTWARCGIDLNTTPLEPGWEGRITIEITNQLPLAVRVHAGQGLGQVVLYPSASGRPCRRPYNRKPNASYQNQAHPFPPPRGPARTP